MKTYLVGGAVRDKLLSLPVTERDWVVVGATGEAMLELGFRQVGRDFPVYLHPETNEEYALARTERKTGGGHRGFECHSDPSVTLEEDLSRRDLTINAIAQDDQGTLIDPYGGRADLEAGLLRHVSPAFVEDPLRVLRVARFAARFAHLDFRIEPETLALMREIAASGELQTLAPERIWAELERALATRSPEVFLASLDACAAAGELFPGVDDCGAACSRLARVAATREETDIRFASLFQGMAEEQAGHLCDRLSTPRRFRELALLVARLGERVPEADKLSPAQLLQILEEADALRRPERFEQLLLTVEALGADADQATGLLRQCLSACQQLDTRQFAEQGLAGHEIGKKIRAAREQQIATLHRR